MIDFYECSGYDEAVSKSIEHCQEMESIFRKDKIWKKRRKHVKDNRKTNWDKRKHGDRSIENKLVKHLRAQKVYTAEEYIDGLPELTKEQWADYEYELYCEEMDWYDWEGNDWYWTDYVDKETGIVLDEWELMARERELDESLEGWVEFCNQFIK